MIVPLGMNFLIIPFIFKNTGGYRLHLSETALSMIHTNKWDQGFLDLIHNTQHNSIAAFEFWLPKNLSPWRHDKITILGDAIHPMPPTGGLGASTAIIDAILLARMLTQNNDLKFALQTYQDKMLVYAPKAVAEGVSPLFWQRQFRYAPVRIMAMVIYFPIVKVVSRVTNHLKQCIRVK